jgi:Methionyl-tRNA synthetase
VKETFYITTPIYYVNDVPHIGHAYTTIACDALARWHRMLGKRVFFLTGTDEHGEKVQKTAAAKGLSPRKLADQVVTNFQGLTPALTISNTGFIRTTEPRHYASVQDLFRKSLANGDIYLGEYEGLYCVPDEAYWTKLQLTDGNCPTCGRPVEKRKEPSYFFRLSKYQEPLLDYYRKHPAFIRPESRRNEVVAFVEGGLNDLSVSRTSLSWGIPVPEAPHVSTSGTTPSPTTSPGWGTQRPRRSSGRSGPPTSTWWGRTSSGSTPSTGPRSSCPPGSRRRSGCSPTDGGPSRGGR